MNRTAGSLRSRPRSRFPPSHRKGRGPGDGAFKLPDGRFSPRGTARSGRRTRDAFTSTTATSTAHRRRRLFAALNNFGGRARHRLLLRLGPRGHRNFVDQDGFATCTTPRLSIVPMTVDLKSSPPPLQAAWPRRRKFVRRPLLTSRGHRATTGSTRRGRLRRVRPLDRLRPPKESTSPREATDGGDRFPVYPQWYITGGRQ